jgi:hypothetical protein
VVYFRGYFANEGSVMVSGKVQIEVTTKNRTPNMPSLARVVEILRARESSAVPAGMNATVPSASVRITGCPRMYGGKSLPDHCSVTDTQDCPSDQAAIDNCPTC